MGAGWEWLVKGFVQRDVPLVRWGACVAVGSLHTHRTVLALAGEVTQTTPFLLLSGDDVVTEIGVRRALTLQFLLGHYIV